MHYNDIVRMMYDELYKMNVGCDIVNPSCNELEKYDLIVIPALYSSSDELLARLNDYVRNGGHVIYTFKSGFTDENVKVRTSLQPGIIQEACGIGYSTFAEPKSVSIRGDLFDLGKEELQVHTWMELITPTTAEVLAYYDHPHWGTYAAITMNRIGEGTAAYIGCFTGSAVVGKVLEYMLKEAGLWGIDQRIRFPLIVKSGINGQGKKILYYFNYSDRTQSIAFPYANGIELIKGLKIRQEEMLEIERWGMLIVEVS